MLYPLWSVVIGVMSYVYLVHIYNSIDKIPVLILKSAQFQYKSAPLFPAILTNDDS